MAGRRYFYNSYVKYLFDHQSTHNTIDTTSNRPTTQPTQVAIIMKMCRNTTFRARRVRWGLLGINGII